MSFKERTVEVEEALMKPTSTLSKILVDLNKTRQFRAESEQVTLTSPFVSLVALMPSLGGGLVMSIVNDYDYSTAITHGARTFTTRVHCHNVLTESYHRDGHVW